MVPATALATIGLMAMVAATATVVTAEDTATADPRATTGVVVARLRSVNASLARIDHDYQGHRVRAMRSISMAIRQLSYRSMNYGGMGASSGMDNGRAMGMRQGGGGATGALAGVSPMSQAQSDARMSQDLRVLQGINMQVGSQGNIYLGARPGERTHPAGNSRVECRPIDPLTRRR